MSGRQGKLQVFCRSIVKRGTAPQAIREQSKVLFDKECLKTR